MTTTHIIAVVTVNTITSSTLATSFIHSGTVLSGFAVSEKNRIPLSAITAVDQRTILSYKDKHVLNTVGD
jgi:hypothetical protein